jgi:hypothetical protein
MSLTKISYSMINGDLLNVLDFGAVGDGTTDDTAAIQAAINSGIANDKAVFIPAGTYILAGVLTGGANLRLFGEGVGLTILQKKTTTTGHILDFYGTTNKSNIEISHIEFQVNNIDSGIWAEYVTNFYIHDCAFSDIPYWGVVVGAQDGSDATIRNDNVLIERCTFTNITQTYEGVLIFNAQDVTIRDCRFVTGSLSIGIGMYQNINRITVDNCYFNIHIGLYYSVSCNDITIINSKFYACSGGVQGANQSDNGTFGAVAVQNLILNNNIFNECTGVACTVGAAYDVTISNCLFFKGKQQALVFNSGFSPINQNPKNISVVGCTFRNNGTLFNGVVTAYACALYIGTAQSSSIYLNITNCLFDDNQTTPTQVYPITFDGAYTYSNINISNCNLSAYSGATSVTSTGSTFDWTVQIENCQNETNGIPVGIRRKMFGSGTPEAAVTAGIGSMFSRIDGGAGTSLYIKQSGTGNTGWVGK